MLFGKHVGWCSDATPLGNTVRRLGVLEQRFDKEEAAVTVELETPFLLLVYLVEGERREWEKEREGEEKDGGHGGVVSRNRLSTVGPTKQKEERLLEMLIFL